MSHLFDAVIFDMDGLLIDSEPLWQEAEIDCFRNIGITLTLDHCRAMAGRRIDEVIAQWHAQFGWNSPSPEEMVKRVISRVTDLIMDRGQPLPGVHALVDSLSRAGLKLAIASSSPPELIQAVISKLNLELVLELWHSGTAELRGKPDPAVFLSTARRLGVEPSRCLVFEDAPAGVLAGHRAGMVVIAVPSVFEPDDPGFLPAQQVLTSLEAFDLPSFEQQWIRQQRCSEAP